MRRCDFWTEPLVVGGVSLPSVQCELTAGHAGVHVIAYEEEKPREVKT